MLTTSTNPSRLAFCDDTHGMPVLRTGQRHIQCVIELKKISALLASIFGTMGRRRTVLSPCCNYTCHPKAGSTERNYNEHVGFFRSRAHSNLKSPVKDVCFRWSELTGPGSDVAVKCRRRARCARVPAGWAHVARCCQIWPNAMTNFTHLVICIDQ